jgi:hypothetical protein
MIDELKPYAEYKESGSSVLPHLRKSAQSVDKTFEANPQISQARRAKLKFASWCKSSMRKG